jgi:hypothetical protein
MIQLDGPNLTVRRGDGSVTVSSSNDVLDMDDMDEDATPCQRDFRADEISGASDDEPVEAPSEVEDAPWPTPSALKKGYSLQNAFQSDMDSDSNPEGGQAEADERGTRGGGSTTRINMVRLIKFGFDLIC